MKKLIIGLTCLMSISALAGECIVSIEEKWSSSEEVTEKITFAKSKDDCSQKALELVEEHRTSLGGDHKMVEVIGMFKFSESGTVESTKNLFSLPTCSHNGVARTFLEEDGQDVCSRTGEWVRKY